MRNREEGHLKYQTAAGQPKSQKAQYEQDMIQTCRNDMDDAGMNVFSDDRGQGSRLRVMEGKSLTGATGRQIV